MSPKKIHAEVPPTLGPVREPCYLVAQSCLTLLVTPWTVALQAPLSVGFPRQEY